MGDHRKLKVWQRARALTFVVYKITDAFPAEEKYGLKAQCRRAAASIAGNIAEGCGRNGDRELLRFVRISSGSASELDSHLTVALDQGMADAYVLRKALRSLGEIRGMLASLAQRLDGDD